MFRFKNFTVEQDLCAMKVGTDGVLLGAWARGGEQVLDVGTGTGLIALMMMQRYPEARVTALDIDEGAVRQATINVEQAKVKDRIRVVQQRVQEHKGQYDAIVSNPPFFIDSLNAPDVQRNTARHAETLTYAELVEAAWRLQKDAGDMSVVVPCDSRQPMEDEATFRGFFPSRVCAVKTVERKPAKRYLLAFRKHPCQCVKETMTVGDEQYRQLTGDFYL